MARQIQLEFAWSTEASSPETGEIVPPQQPESHEPQVVTDIDAANLPHLNGLTIPESLPGAIEFGIFGIEESGPIVPDAEQIALLVQEHAQELLVTLMDIDALEDGIRRGIDPLTGRASKTEDQRMRLDEFLRREKLRLERTRDDALAVYADAFGDEAAALLEEHVLLWASGRLEREPQYDPGHPWHYLLQGEGRSPVPADTIESNPSLIATFKEKLPRDPKKRHQKLQDMLEAERAAIDSAKRRYQEIVEHGAQALSDYDRTIAYSNDEQARAGSLALSYNNIRYRLSRIQWLEEHLSVLASSIM